MRHLWIGLVCAAFVVGCNGTPTPSVFPNQAGNGDKATTSGNNNPPGAKKPGGVPPP